MDGGRGVGWGLGTDYTAHTHPARTQRLWVCERLSSELGRPWASALTSAQTHMDARRQRRAPLTHKQTQASAVTHFEASLSFLFANEVKEAKIFNTIYS